MSVALRAKFLNSVSESITADQLIVDEWMKAKLRVQNSSIGTFYTWLTSQHDTEPESAEENSG